MPINSRQTLLQYALNKLGAPLLEINVSDSQMNYIVDDVIQLYQERVYDGTEEVYLKYKITQTDIDNKCTNTPVINPGGLSFESNNNYLTLPDHIIGVSEVLQTTSNVYQDMFGRSPEYFIYDQFNFYNNQAFDLTDLYMMRQTIDNIRNVVTPENRIRYNKETNRLYLDFNINSLLNKYIIIICSRAVDPQQFTKLYNSRFVKEYTTILLKEQWGTNLSKFANIQLPGGVMFDSTRILNEAKTEKAEFLEKMKREWETDVPFIVG
jgi:hypothetical protein